MNNFYKFYTYSLASQRNGTLYIGVTNNLERRVYEHKIGLGNKFSMKYNVNKLVYFETFQNINDAILREKRLKKWNRVWKIKLIEEEHKDWNDLAKDWFENI